MLTELELHVLLAVADGAAHGYAIGKDIEERSGGRLDPTTGALYQVLKRLAAEGLIRQVDVRDSADARRKYFALTAAGRRAVAAEVRRLEELVDLARDRRLYPADAR
jgi:DNA-binding PadR family transcriptional regulator